MINISFMWHMPTRICLFTENLTLWKLDGKCNNIILIKSVINNCAIALWNYGETITQRQSLHDVYICLAHSSWCVKTAINMCYFVLENICFNHFRVICINKVDHTHSNHVNKIHTFIVTYIQNCWAIGLGGLRI